MDRRYSRSEKGKWQAPSEPPAKKPPVRIPANDNEDLIKANKLTIISRLTNPMAKIWVEVNGLIPLVMKMEIELPTDDITEVELEYIKIEKHCFTCFSLFHEEVDCPHRHPSALPPKQRKLGITQAIALQRIEAEKKRHDDRRGYKRPEDLRSSIRGQEDSYARSGMNRSASRYYQNKREEPCREQSILSRTARPNSNYQRYKAPTMQYRVVETSRTNAGASAPLQNVDGRNDEVDFRGSQRSHAELDHPIETTPICTLKERLGAPTDAINGSNSGSKERRSALERLSESRVVEEQRERRTPTLESGRLQLPPVEEEREVNKIIDTLEQPDFTERVPATLRLGEGGSNTNARRGEVPIATQSKAVTKRKVTKTPGRKRVVRSPLLRANQKKTSSVRADTAIRRKLVVDKDLNVPYSLEQVLCPVLILGSRVLVPEDDIQEVGEGVSALLPYNIEIRLPEDESQLLSQKNRLEGDMKMVQFEGNKNQSIPHEPQYHCIFAVCMFDTVALACYYKYKSYRYEPKIVVAVSINPTLLIASRNMLKRKKMNC
ncbi:hypothetical protein F2Q69_00023713 [Brassica cretica]|uniref:Zinc knuckle CX2CX4HX4C domain-containing protein n=1 Tax=Brassica cretica TaxID=69181 RepID=A0A8S9Q427_BRACR|nr:hypothetical protein F2Q69_00023713 [Brassica cretica]